MEKIVDKTIVERANTSVFASREQIFFAETKENCTKLLDSINGNYKGIINVPDFWLPTIFQYLQLLSEYEDVINISKIYRSKQSVWIDINFSDDIFETLKDDIINEILRPMEKTIDKLILRRVEEILKTENNLNAIKS